MIDISKLSERARAAYQIAEKLSEEYQIFGSWLPGQFDTYIEMCGIIAEETDEYWHEAGKDSLSEDE